jgi:hypothetical protein
MSINQWDEPVGLLKRGTIVGYDPTTDTLKVNLNTASPVKGQTPITVDVPAPHTMFYNNGLFMGSLPVSKTPITVGQGSGNQYYFVSYLAENLPMVPDLTLGEILVQSNDDTYFTLDVNNDIYLGSDNNRIHINTGNKNSPKTNLITINFENENHFTQAYREVGGLIKRDLRFNTNYDQDSKLENDLYDPIYKLIGLDPLSTTNDLITSPTKNPPMVEHREMVYEFQYLSQVVDDLTESLQYGTSKQPVQNYTFPNRRTSRADTLSLSLVEPNYLMESIKGSVVDIFGNLLDINRYPLPVGQNQYSLRAQQGADKQLAYTNIRALERRSMAYHFEINARKDLTNATNTLDALDINSNADNSVIRSRFHFDIDKEGQLKLNVPASSETGNVPLLVRYENYSTFGPEDNGNPNKLIYRDDNLDLFLDSFAAPRATPTDDGFSYASVPGSITIMNGNAAGAPIDRITGTHIMHGTAHHDILNTCYAQQSNDVLNYFTGAWVTPTVDISPSSVPYLANVATSVIDLANTVPGTGAGGRSGVMNFDGSVECSIGANTIDRQSLWLDLAGGAVVNIGRDIKDMSMALSLNGDTFIQIGGIGVTGDSRFATSNNGAIGAVFDLRVITGGGYAHWFRCDANGVTVMSPGNVAIHAGANLKLSADSNIDMDAETITIQGRMVLKEFGGSI